jgi:hypothetical protein
MSILYALIAKNFDLILTEYTEYSGNFQQITRILLYKIKINYNKYNNENSKGLYSIKYDNNYEFNYLIKDNLVFLCMAFTDNNNNYNNSPINYSINDNNNINQNLVWAFLFDVKKFFYTEYTPLEIDKFKSYELQEFEKTLYLLMTYYNAKPNFTKSGLPIDNIMNENENITIDNINKYFDTDETMNIIVVQNEAYNSQTIRKKNIVLSGYIRRKEKIEQIKTVAKILSFIIGFIFVLYLMVHFFGNKENSSMNQNKQNLKRIK